VHDGWLTGAEQAAHKQGGQVLSRVLLLSDLRQPRTVRYGRDRQAVQ
jgi:hypothetical protein